MYIILSNTKKIPIKNIRDLLYGNSLDKKIQIEIDIEKYKKSIEDARNDFFDNSDIITLYNENDEKIDTFKGYCYITNIEKYYYSNIGMFIIVISTKESDVI